jgi:hypothetical protein
MTHTHHRLQFFPSFVRSPLCHNSSSVNSPAHRTHTSPSPVLSNSVRSPFFCFTSCPTAHRYFQLGSAAIIMPYYVFSEQPHPWHTSTHHRLQFFRSFVRSPFFCFTSCLAAHRHFQLRSAAIMPYCVFSDQPSPWHTRTHHRLHFFPSSVRSPFFCFTSCSCTPLFPAWFSRHHAILRLQ